jgi:hypothetical protein
MQFVLLFEIKTIFKKIIVHFCMWKMVIMLTRSMKKQMNEVLQQKGGDVPGMLVKEDIFTR